MNVVAIEKEVQVVEAATEVVVTIVEKEVQVIEAMPTLVIYNTVGSSESYTHLFTNTEGFTVGSSTHGLTKVSDAVLLDSNNVKMSGTVQINTDLSINVSFSKAFTGKLIIS